MASNSSAPVKRRRSVRRKFMVVGGVVAALVAGWVVYATVNILNPSQGDLEAHRDAVVSLAPQGHRLPVAQQLVADGIADTLVISYFDHDPLNHGSNTSEFAPLHAYCDSDAKIVCFTPEENATIGEAYAIAGLAREHGWESLTIVTDTTHVFRTRFILEQCLGDEFDVNVVVAARELGRADQAWWAVYENAAFLKAVWQTSWRC